MIKYYYLSDLKEYYYWLYAIFYKIIKNIVYIDEVRLNNFILY
jgi:hypothetical protein